MSNAPNEAQLDKIRARAEKDLFYFAQVVGPHRVYGDVHQELFEWIDRPTKKDNQLVLLPRDHLKSHVASVTAAHWITKNPAETILYVSATSGLAEDQLRAIKNILESDIYQLLWPDMINPDEGKREMWNNTAICVDHPLRRAEGVRDATIFAAGLTTNICGKHYNKVILDDMVVPNNAYTAEGRTKVSQQYSQLASIETTGAQELVVGTRYHPVDIYQTIRDMTEEVWEEDEIVAEEPVYEVFERVVELEGVFLWPRTRRPDGKFFGFNAKELARKKAKYVDRTQFFAQYYNDPNDPESQRIKRDKFQYYDPKFISQRGGTWYFKDSRLNIVAAVDFAYSLTKKADHTAIVVIGIDAEHNIYVLKIDRFKTDRLSVYFDHIKALHDYWGFRKLRAECNAAQSVIVKDLKYNHIAKEGLAISVDEVTVTRHEGTKEERINNILEHRYDNGNMWHYKGGYCQLLEEEVMMARPAHDDIKDALAAAVDCARAPTLSRTRRDSGRDNVLFSNKFGGVAFR